ncbi:arrestin (or s-antigen) n-terminal domain protein [Lasallia pustulata]|uniref:Arrestin (Or s-antigen) n-terminal domain protein n=1 Tax=Lasallia pustulata TaxID=136370 RepID=A0A1W5CZZ2_9LECA|nr:arrestin (or s-antigen) n-terminal domain protein [Lasallia pustulata]
MDIFHHHHHHKEHSKEKRPSLSGKSGPGRKGSPKVAETVPAKLDVVMESPPLVFYGDATHSTGALLSGQLSLTVAEPEVKLQTMEMQMLATCTTKKPVDKNCPDCSTKTNEVYQWAFLTEPAVFKKGTHSFPFSYLMPGHYPATSDGRLGTIEYSLSARALTSCSEIISFTRPLKVQRALQPGNDKTSIRIFPPTQLAATVVLPPVIHPIGEFPVQMRIDGCVDRGKETQTHWSIKKMNWRIDERTKVISAACPKHAHKVGGEGKGVLHQDNRVIGGEDMKNGWKTDFDSPGGLIEMEFMASIKPGSNPLCDVETPTGFTVTHNLVIELIVAEEYCTNKNTKLVTPTGTARVLRMQFTLVLTERSGMGISWDEETPPTYEDVPTSPPGYQKMGMEDYNGEPFPYEELDSMRRGSA